MNNLSDATTSDAAALIEDGLTHHRAGRLGEAEAAYRRALATAPDDPVALHLLGVTAHQSGNHGAAVTLIERAIRVRSDEPAFHNNLGTALRALGRLDEAATAYRRAVALKPDYAEAHHDLALVLRSRGKLDEALASLRMVVARQPGFTRAHSNLAGTLELLGRHEEAAAACREAIARNPDSPDLRVNLSTTLRALGRADEAEASCQRALEIDPDLAEAHNNLGIALLDQGRLDEAATAFRMAIALKPGLPEPHNNLGNALKDMGRLDEAIDAFRRALAAGPNYVLAHNNLGVALHDQGELDAAVTAFRKAIDLMPDFPEALGNLGNALRDQGRLDAAVDAFQRALGARPNDAAAHSNLASALFDQGRLDEAFAGYRRALDHDPNFAPAHNNLGIAHSRIGEPDRAIAAFERAITLDPGFAEAHNNLANALKDQGRIGAALAAHRKAIEREPDRAKFHNDLGNLFAEQGRVDEAAACYRRTLAGGPNDAITMKLAMLLPAIPRSADDIRDIRRRFEDGVSALLDRDLAVRDPVSEIGITSFYMAYHGHNDRDLQMLVAKLYATACPSLDFVAPHCAGHGRARRGARIEVGFISRFIGDHSVGNMLHGVIASLPRDAISVTLISMPKAGNPTVTGLRNAADRTIEVPPNLDAARREIAGLGLDVLVYADIGMDPFTYFLAFSRLAPVQCVMAGHPVTTGIPAIDYFLSSKLLEANGADAHYSETLVRLDGFPARFVRPSLPARAKAKAALGLPETGTLYTCPMATFKLHPDGDAALAAILRHDPAGHIVLFEHPTISTLHGIVRKRFCETMADVADRVTFLPFAPKQDFMSILMQTDVVLDSFPFGAGTTAFIVFATGTPIVTWPHAFMRGRVVAACYGEMGIGDCVARSLDEYVAIAVRLGTDPDFRQGVKERILESNGVLYDNPAGVEAMARFFYGLFPGGAGRP